MTSSMYELHMAMGNMPAELNTILMNDMSITIQNEPLDCIMNDYTVCCQLSTAYYGVVLKIH